MRLVFDFDGTITVRDTISALAKAAIRHQHEQHGHDLSATWDQVVREYMTDCRQFNEAYDVPEKDRLSLEDERAYLSALKSVEAASLVRVEGSKIFSGLDNDGLFRMGAEAVSRGDVALRDGFAEIVSLAERKGWEVGVISVNWSRSFIEGALDPLKLTVYANQITAKGGIEGPPLLRRQLTSSSGKLEVLRKAFGTSDGHAGDKTVYFGDSTTDLECLLEGGIVIAASADPPNASSLLQTLKRVGVQVPHVGSPHVDGNTNLAWARDFQEVLGSDMLSAHNA